MRGEKPKMEEQIRQTRFAVAEITDPNGNVLYKVISTRWFNTLLVVMAVLLVGIAALSVLVFENGRKINQVEQKVDSNANTYDGH